MTELEKLNERISQLTELVKSGEETINATKEMLKLVEQERDRLADQRRESEPKFERVGRGKGYSYLFVCRAGVCVDDTSDVYSEIDNEYFSSNNYFRTKKRAQEVADKINLLLKLERLHDTFCSDYTPDWNNLDDYKNFVIYDALDKHWYYSQTIVGKNETCAYFPTRAIAKQVCDILNAEERSKDV